MAHVDAFWTFFLVDLQTAINRENEDVVAILRMFYSLNGYLCSQRKILPYMGIVLDNRVLMYGYNIEGVAIMRGWGYNRLVIVVCE